jgi:hypothetical protein
MKHDTRAIIKHSSISLALMMAGLAAPLVTAANIATEQLSYAVVDTSQTQCLGLKDTLAECPVPGDETYGQDSQYRGFQPDYTDNNNGTVTDNNTRLMWAQAIDINGDGKVTVDDKLSYNDAISYAANLKLAGYSDWRIPSIKELYSLMMFDGEDPSGLQSSSGEVSIMPFIDHSYFGYHSGDTDAGERLIDAQYVSSTRYVSTTMKGDETVFGVNFIDGRIKGYGMTSPRDNSDKTFYVLAVRGNSDYGLNDFVDNNNGAINDKATGLTWQQADSGMGMDWTSALAYCENLTLAGRSDWRLPNAKELQSIVDYSRSPDTSNSAAVDGLFTVSSIVNEADKLDYPNYWSSTTHKNLRNTSNAVYVAFGRSMGKMQGSWMDVHGAGSQRSDPKVANGQDYSDGHGPQGDSVRINNYVRCVTGGAELDITPAVVERETKVFTLTGNEAGSMMSQGQSGTKSAELPELGGGSKGNMRPNGRPSVDELFAMMDRNSDNRLSRQEVKGPLRQDFDRLDKNSDGYLEKSEIPAAPRKGKQR